MYQMYHENVSFSLEESKMLEDWNLFQIPDQDLDGLITWFGGLGLALRISEPLMDFPLAQSKARFGHPGSWLG